MSLINSLQIQSRVIHALILRETRTRFGRSKMGYLWAIFEPVSYIVVLVTIFSLIGRGSPIGNADDLPLFFLTGLIPWFMFLHASTKTMHAINGNKALLTYPQVTPFDVLIARAILEMVTLYFVFMLVLPLFAYFGYTHKIESYLGIFSALSALWILGTGMGFLSATIMLYIPSFDQTYNAIQRPFFFVSGIFFTAESLPSQLQELIVFNPILHGVEWFRSAFFNNYDSQLIDKQYLIASGLIMLTVGLSVQRLARRRARQA